MNLFQLGGTIEAPLKSTYANVDTGFPELLSNIIRLATIFGGLLVLINFILAGYGFITATGDPKKVQDSWTKIWQSLVGLIIIVGALAFVSIAEAVFKIDILQPKITGPGTIN